MWETFKEIFLIRWHDICKTIYNRKLVRIIFSKLTSRTMIWGKLHLVNRFTSVEYTYNNFFRSLLCYVLYSVRLEFMRQGIADWPSRVWRRVQITSAVALRVVKASEREPSAGGYNWTTLFPGMGTWPSRLGESRIWDSKIWSWVLRYSDLRMNVLARASSNCKLQINPLVREDIT
jgi:hypothetical protein